MNDVSKFIAPLIDDNINEADLSADSGFIDAYTEDINRPYLEDKVFLLYKVTNTKQSLDTYLKLSKLDCLYNIRPIVVDGEHYRIYTFVALNKDIKQLKQGCMFKDCKSRVRILDFWSNKSDDLIKRVLLPNFQLGRPIKAVSPEEDYYPYEV
jgi:hypothetical protein